MHFRIHSLSYQPYCQHITGHGLISRNRYLQATTSGRYFQTATSEPYFQAVTSKPPLPSPTSKPSCPNRHSRALLLSRHVQTATLEPYFQAVMSQTPLPSPTSRPSHLSHYLKTATSLPESQGRQRRWLPAPACGRESDGAWPRQSPRRNR